MFVFQFTEIGSKERHSLSGSLETCELASVLMVNDIEWDWVIFNKDNALSVFNREKKIAMQATCYSPQKYRTELDLV